MFRRVSHSTTKGTALLKQQRTRVPGPLRRRTVLATATAIVVVVALGACAFGGNAVSASKTEQVNLANQREAAIAFLAAQRGVEKITFTHDGGHPGLGASWRANAVVSIGGDDYQAILSTEPGIDISDPLPSVSPDATQTSVTIVYSDGTSEVIE